MSVKSTQPPDAVEEGQAVTRIDVVWTCSNCGQEGTISRLLENSHPLEDSYGLVAGVTDWGQERLEGQCLECSQIKTILDLDCMFTQFLEQGRRDKPLDQPQPSKQE